MGVYVPQSVIGANMLEIHANAKVLDDALIIYANAVELSNEHEIYAFAKGFGVCRWMKF